MGSEGSCGGCGVVFAAVVDDVFDEVQVAGSECGSEVGNDSGLHGFDFSRNGVKAALTFRQTRYFLIYLV